MTTLRLESRRLGDVTVVKCTGRIVGGVESAILHQRVLDLLPHDPFIVLDLAGVESIDSAGLGMLVRLLNRARAARGDLTLSAAPPRILEVLRITRLQALLRPFPSEDAAVAALYEASPASEAGTLSGADVLCVDPSADVLAYVREIVQRAGHGIITSDNLPDGLCLLKATRPKVVVIGAVLRAARDTETGQTFNRWIDAAAVIELAADFSRHDAGAAGARLLDALRAALTPGA